MVAPFTTITPAAEERIKELTNESSFFRISVVSGGCAGYMYEFNLERLPGPDDTIINDIIIVDSYSLSLLKESKLDYIDTGFSAKFEISGPDACSTCGCGKSFGV